MDTGDIAPDYVRRFSQRTDHPVTWHRVVDELQEQYTFDWPRLIGTVFAHREASMIAALRALDAALAKPKVTRPGLRREMVVALAAIAARGPEAISSSLRKGL